MLPLETQLMALLGLCFAIAASASSSALTDVEKVKLESFKVELQHTLEGARIRRKRQSLATVSDKGGFSAERLRVGSSSPDVPTYLTDKNLTFLTSVDHLERRQVLTGNTLGDLSLFDVTETNRDSYLIASGDSEQVGYKAQGFSYFDEQWFVVLKRTVSRTWVQLYAKVGRGLEKRQTITLPGDADFLLISVRGVRYLAVVTFGIRTGSSYSVQGSILLYQWYQTQFDLIATRDTFGARSVALWILDGTLYMAVSQESDGNGNVNVGSPVFMFNSRRAGGSLILVDKLRTSGPIKVEHFYVGGSHYLIFVGTYEARIYWWSSGQFLLWQKIAGTENSSGVSVIKLENGEVVLAVVLKEAILFLTLDSSGHYVVSFTMEFTGSILGSVQFMFDGLYHYFLAIFAKYSGSVPPQSVWKIVLDKYDIGNVNNVDSLIQCVSGLKDAVNGRRKELEMVQFDVDRVWVSNKEQVVVASVVVEGSVTSGEQTIVDEIEVLKNDHTPTVPIKAVQTTISELGLVNSDLSRQLVNVVYGSNHQEISGHKMFFGVTSTPSLNLPAIGFDININEISVFRLASNVLKKSGDQTVHGLSSFDGLSSTQSVKTSLLDNADTADLLLLQGKQEIIGQLKFGNVLADELEVQILNSVPLHNVVTVGTEQDIEELKMFDVFKAKEAFVQGQTNGEFLSEIVNRSVMVNTESTHFGGLRFDSPLNAGNVLLNGKIDKEIDIAELDAFGMKKSFPQLITATHTFDSPVGVFQDLNLAGRINGMLLDDLLTVSTPQNLTGNLVFQNRLGLGSGLTTGTLNGLLFDQDPVLRHEASQVVSDRKSFKTLGVRDAIDVSTDAVIDGIDVSSEAETVLSHEKGVIKDSGFLKNAIVLKNLTALEGINGYDVFDLPETVLLKSKFQQFDWPFRIPSQVVIEQDLEVTRVNDLNLETDVIHTVTDEDFDSSFDFSDEIVVRRRLVTDRRYFDGANLTSYQNLEKVAGLGQDVVLGTKTLSSLTVLGSIHTDAVNELPVPGAFVRPYAGQIVSGRTFFNATVHIAGHLVTANIDLKVISDVPFQPFVQSAVLKTNPAVLSDKRFIHLKAKDLKIFGGRIGGVLIPELITKVALINAEQFIVSDKAFIGNVEFVGHATCRALNEMELSLLSNDVVLSGEDYPVTGTKTFKGFIGLNQMNIKALLNNVNVNDLNRNTLSKTKPNDITAFVFFGNTLEIAVFHPQALFDGLSLSNLVPVHENFSFERDIFMSRFQAMSHLSMSGYANNCNLNKIRQVALMSSDQDKMAAGVFTLKSLRVRGDIVVEKYLNDVSVWDLVQIVVKDGRYHVVSGDFHIHPGISASNFNIVGYLNNSDVDFLLDDAVTKSYAQNVHGHKIFHENMAVGTLASGDVISRANNVDILDLYDTAVFKTGDLQYIDGEKTFSDVRAHNLTVRGVLNGVRFPEEVVTTFADEVIRGTVYMVKGMDITSDLTVDMRADSVNLDQLARDRFTLHENSDVSAELEFAESSFVEGDLAVESLLNQLDLKLAVPTKSFAALDGFKSFDQSLEILGHLTVASVNGLDITRLEHDVANLRTDETLDQLVVFSQSLHAGNDLLSSVVNDISLPKTMEPFQDDSYQTNWTVGFFRDLTIDQENQLVQQAEISTYDPANFAYFVLTQELQLKASKILLAYPEQTDNVFTSHSLVAWSSVEHCSSVRKCCQTELSYWLKMDSRASISVQRGPEPGLHWPIRNLDPLLYDHKLTVFTNATRTGASWCQRFASGTILGALDGETGIRILLQASSSAPLKEVRTFKEDFYYVVAAFHYDYVNSEHSATVIFRGHPSSNEWTRQQVLPFYGALSMDLTSVESKREKATLLALGSGFGSYPESFSSVYKWNSALKQFDWLQNIQSQLVTSTLWIHNKDNQLLLALAGVDQWSEDGAECAEVTSGGQINVYAYDQKLTWVQSIPLQGVVSMVYFNLEGETYLAVASAQFQAIYILQYRGYGKFVETHSIPAMGVRHLNLFLSGGNTYMTVASAVGPSRVFRAQVWGQRLDTNPDPNQTPSSEMSDQPLYDKRRISTC